MSDDKSKRGSPDRERISLSEDYEVRDWAKSLGVGRFYPPSRTTRT